MATLIVQRFLSTILHRLISSLPTSARYRILRRSDPQAHCHSQAQAHPHIIGIGRAGAVCLCRREVIAGDTIGLYGRNLGVQSYAILTSYTIGFMVLGYILGVSTIPKLLKKKNALLSDDFILCGLRASDPSLEKLIVCLIEI